MPFRLGSVNCYLLNTDNGFFLIDTSSSNNRDELERVLQRAGCEPGQLKMIILTHGDFDHSGNAAYLRKKFDAKTAMHKDDLGMVKDGNMFSSRQKGNNIFTRKLIPLLIGFGESERFEPDIYLEDGDNLSQFGIKAKVLSIPGHSQGSIGILTNAGDLFCGDLFESTKDPGLNSLMDDPTAAGLSVQKIKSLDVGTVYPGHGTPFQMEKF
jgi:glyoxylase-like metal-dependent hydrolase (beta-lactamase superfamily II)